MLHLGPVAASWSQQWVRKLYLDTLTPIIHLIESSGSTFKSGKNCMNLIILIVPFYEIMTLLTAARSTPNLLC